MSNKKTEILKIVANMVRSGEIEKLKDGIYYVRRARLYANNPWDAYKKYIESEPPLSSQEKAWQLLTNEQKQKIRKEFNKFDDNWDKYSDLIDFAYKNNLMNLGNPPIMIKQELIIPCRYGYMKLRLKGTKTQMYAYVYNDPRLFVRAKNLLDVKKKLKAIIKAMKLPFRLKFTWKLE